MDRFVRVYSGGELVKGPNGVEFGGLPEEGIWFKAAPTFDELIDAVYKKLGWKPATHNVHAQGRMNVGGGAHRHFILVPINDDMSWNSYVNAVFNGTEWNCLEIYVQAERKLPTETIASECAGLPSEMDIEPPSARPRNPEPNSTTVMPAVMATDRSKDHPQPQNSKPKNTIVMPAVMVVRPPKNARLRNSQKKKSTKGHANKDGQVVHAEVQSDQGDQGGASGTVDATRYPLIGLYDDDHRARAIASGQGLTELCPRAREPLRFDKRYERYLRPAGLMGVANMCTAGLPSIDRALVSALVDRWRPETHTFHMPCGEITITLQDVAMILGLPIAGLAVTTGPQEPQNDLLERYLGKAPPSDHRPGLRVTWMRAEFENCPEDTDEETVKQHARAYVLSLLGGVLFPDASGDRYTNFPLPLVVNLEHIGLYSWGSATLAYLYRAMCDACRRQGDQSNLTGCLLLLQLWSWERFPIGRPDTIKLKYPNVEELEDERDRPTVGLRWVVGVNVRRAAPARCYEHFTNEFDLLTDDQVVWCPYSQERVKELKLAPICTHASHLWLTQAPLIYFFAVEVYMPERVMRQFGLHQECPPPLRDTNVELHWCNRRGRIHNDWALWHKAYVDIWELNAEHVILEDRPYNHAHYMDYLRWYRLSTRTRLCPPRRMSNGHKGEASGRVANAASEDPIHASQLRYTPRAHLIHSVTDKLSILAKEAAAKKGYSGSESHAFVERVMNTCIEVIEELGGTPLCDIADVITCSSTTATVAAEPELNHQRDEEEEINNSVVPGEEDINHSVVPGEDTGSDTESEKQTLSQLTNTQADGTVRSKLAGKRKRGKSGPRGK